MKLVSLILAACLVGGLTMAGATAPAGGTGSDKAAQTDRQTVADRPDPVVVLRIDPVYPEEMRIAGIEGRAVIEFLVDTVGQVRVPTVIEASHPEFGRAALEAVQHWEFAPAMENGEAVPRLVVVPVEFKLVEEAAQEPTRISNLSR